MRGRFEGRLIVAAAWCGVWGLGVLLAAAALAPLLATATAAASRSVPVTPAALRMDPIQVASVQVASAQVATIKVTVRDTDGRVVENAVVTLAPAGGAAAAAVPAEPPAAGPAEARPILVDQMDEAFVPLVQAVPAGRPVAFRNSDRTLHHVYSFSPAKRFELRVRPEETSTPVPFDTPGIVSLGCNIHDHMVAWLYVAETQWAAVTGPGGGTAFADVPAGDYVARVWHPRLRPGVRLGETPVMLASGSMEVHVELPLTQARSGGRDRERKSY